MQDILDVMTSRKSIRRYKTDPVSDDMLDKIPKFSSRPN